MTLGIQFYCICCIEHEYLNVFHGRISIIFTLKKKHACVSLISPYEIDNPWTKMSGRSSVHV